MLFDNHGIAWMTQFERAASVTPQTSAALEQLQTVEKRFFMNLSQCVNATLQASQGQCTIRQLRLLITRNAGEIMLQFPTGTAQSYALEQNTDLNDRLGWRALAGADSLQGTGEVLTFRDTAQGHGRCYRVRLLP